MPRPRAGRIAMPRRECRGVHGSEGGRCPALDWFTGLRVNHTLKSSHLAETPLTSSMPRRRSERRMPSDLQLTRESRFEGSPGPATHGRHRATCIGMHVRFCKTRPADEYAVPPRFRSPEEPAQVGLIKAAGATRLRRRSPIPSPHPQTPAAHGPCAACRHQEGGSRQWAVRCRPTPPG